MPPSETFDSRFVAGQGDVSGRNLKKALKLLRRWQLVGHFFSRYGVSLK